MSSDSDDGLLKVKKPKKIRTLASPMHYDGDKPMYKSKKEKRKGKESVHET